MAREEDLRMLIEMIDDVESGLQKIIDQRITLLRQEVAGEFPGPWPRVRQAIQTGKRELYNIQWEYVEGVGLAGPHLAHKKRLWDIDFKSRILGFFLPRVNSLMGSLAKIVPVFEVVKEYKEQVECSVKELKAKF